MKALRQICVQDCVAAVLRDYDLKFYGSSASNRKQLVETSAAFVEPVSSNPSTSSNSTTTSLVHGVLYTLSEEDFVKVGRTEGVPFAYRWQPCLVYPYLGDGESAGLHAIETTDPVEAYTLVPPSSQQEPSRQQVAPSASYLGLIQEGAELWKFDRAYRDQLAAVEVASNLLVSEGVSGFSLKLAELSAGIDRTYKIRVPNSYVPSRR
ncbi:hypothetical protein IV203_022456 [Nitzschia inconspicua]|uniref:Gamma-glutamylcyclotransferase n=1 Tax=Nitzschia inconspicua TaxID=303405 RepID=A0A9K3K6K0_9STRA|nr:hypothetical protein IV203_024616 [Nitzschia inconspicua]KAG7344448.1 hypothetical protein IV203_022456 [Nitzschia inconspicua]